MKLSELLQVKSNLGSMSRKDLEKTCSVLIDAVMVTNKGLKKKKKKGKRGRDRDPDSKSETFRRDDKIWPKCVAEKYSESFLHEVGNYIYARTKEFGSKKIIDKPISHYVWKMHYGDWPAKGRRLLHLDKDKKNNTYKNLHPQDGVYE